MKIISKIKYITNLVEVIGELRRITLYHLKISKRENEINSI